jgi:hypothetical protein
MTARLAPDRHEEFRDLESRLLIDDRVLQPQTFDLAIAGTSAISKFSCHSTLSWRRRFAVLARCCGAYMGELPEWAVLEGPRCWFASSADN